VSVKRFASFKSNKRYRIEFAGEQRGRRRNAGERTNGCVCVSYAFVRVATKREQKATSVLERSVKCLNKRAIILTRSGISRVFLPSKVSLSFFLSSPSLYFAYSDLPSPSVRSRSVYLFSSRFSGPRRRCRRPRGSRKKHKTRISFVLPVSSSGSPLCSADSDRQPFPAFSRA